MKLLIFLLLLSFFSCELKRQRCKGFNFKRIPYNEQYYLKKLTYSNGYDTINLNITDKIVAKETKWGQGYDCNPNFDVKYSDLFNRLSILYSFNYFDMNDDDTSTYLNLLINSSWFEINLETMQNSLNRELTIKPSIARYLGADVVNTITKIKLKKMRVTEIETYTGIIWKLCTTPDHPLDNQQLHIPLIPQQKCSNN